MWDVVVIGAGIAGLTAARQLHQSGYRLLVLEKSRGLGGRLATRRVSGQPVDHGCRFLKPFQTEDSELIPTLLAEQILMPWQPRIFELNGAGDLAPQVDTDTYYVAPLGLTAVAKFLAAGLTIHRQRRVTHLSHDGDTWHIQAETPQGMNETVKTRAVIAAIPAPQLWPLVRQFGPEAGVSGLVQQLSQVQFAPVITVMAAYGPVAERPFNHPSVHPTGLTNPGWMVFGQDHPVIRWAGLDSSKRQTPAQSIVVLHSAPAFAAGFLDLEDLSKAGQALLETAALTLGPWLATPNGMQTHRWRYGFVGHSLKGQGLAATALPRFVACGDWCNGPNVEAAFRSGQKAATEMQELT